MKNIFKVYKRFLLLTGISLIYTTNCHSSDSLKLDESIRYGKLENGFSYYIKPVEKSSEKINMDLLVKVGWYQEEKDEFEFAHIVEHLSFSSGRNVSLKKSSQEFDEAGITLGSFNGHVWQDYTKYNATVSVQNETGVDLVLRFYKEIIWGLQLNDKNIDLERVAILNEANAGSPDLGSLKFRMENELFGRGSEYPEDYEKYINSIKSEDIRSFYKKWYQPGNISLVVTGDIKDVHEIENQIKQMFSGDPIGNRSTNKENRKEVKEKAPRLLKEELPGSSVANTYLTNLGLYYWNKQDNHPLNNQSLKDQIVRDLFVKMLERRFKQQLQSYNIFYDILTDFLIPSGTLRISVQSREGLNKEILIGVQRTLNEVKSDGFSSKEFEKGKEEMIRSLTNTDTLKSSYWLGQIVQHSVYGENLPANKIKVLQNLIQGMDIGKFNQIIRGFIKNQPDDITIATYSDNPALGYQESEIRNWFKQLNGKSRPFTPAWTPKFLMDPQKIRLLNKVSFREQDSEIPGAKEIILENGVTLLLKSSQEDTNGKIRIKAYSPLGINCFENEDYFSALIAPEVLNNTGVNGLDKFELKRYLDSKEIKGFIKPFAENDGAGFSGSFSSKNAEIALQLIHLYFTASQFNEIAFKDWKMNKKFFGPTNGSPFDDLKVEIKEYLPNNNFIPGGKKYMEGIENTKLEWVKEAYNKMFHNPARFKFLISGDFDEDKILSIARTYLGNLSTYHKNEMNCHGEQAEKFLPSEPITKTFKSPTKLESSLVNLVYVREISPIEYNWQERVRVELLRKILNELLMRKLRFESDQGGVYQVGATLEFVRSHNYHQFSIDFSCLPKDMERLIGEAKQIVYGLCNQMIDEDLLNSHKLKLMEYYGGTVRQFPKMYNYIKSEEEWINAKEEQDYLKSLTVKDIQETATKYLMQQPHVFKLVSPK